MSRVVVGRIVKPFGVRGEVIVAPTGEDPARFSRGERLYVEPVGDEALEIRVSRVRTGNVTVSFEGIDDRDEAEQLVGIVLHQEEEKLPSLPDGVFYHFQLIGLSVEREDGTVLGEVVRVHELPSSDVLEVPLPENSFDALTICYGPRNIVDLPKLWKEMQRLVKPGGQVLSLELTRPPGIMGYFHELYLKFVVPFVGGIVSGDPEAYRYLQKTISGFLSPTEMADSMREAGLVQVKVVPLSGGIVTIHHARTPLSR